MDSRMYPQGKGTLQSKYVSGVLTFTPGGSNSIQYGDSSFGNAGIPIKSYLKDSGYSLNLISVQADGASNNTRGWRVNMTTTASQTQGDLQCVHGYLTLGSSVTLAAGAAVYPLSAWIDVPSDITTATGNVIAGVRAIFDANGLDLSALAGGGESALFYGQVWAQASSAIEHGLRISAGAGTTIKNGLSVGGPGTISRVIDLTDWGKDTTLVLMQGGPKDVTETAHLAIAAGDATDASGIVAALGGTSYGSLYLSTAGSVWYNKAGTWTQVGDV